MEEYVQQKQATLVAYVKDQVRQPKPKEQTYSVSLWMASLVYACQQTIYDASQEASHVKNCEASHEKTLGLTCGDSYEPIWEAIHGPTLEAIPETIYEASYVTIALKKYETIREET